MTRAAVTVDAYNAIAKLRLCEVMNVLTGGGEFAAGEAVVRLQRSQLSVSNHFGMRRKVKAVPVMRRGQHRTSRFNAAELKPLKDRVKTFERYWTHQRAQIKERAERKALERTISNDSEPKEE